jgi:hypothetical protein
MILSGHITWPKNDTLLIQKLVDGILQLVMMCAVEGGDRLPCSVSYHIFVSCSEGWTHVPADHIQLIEGLHNCSILFLPLACDSLDFELWSSGDVDVAQQIPQSTCGNQCFIPKGLYLIGFMVHLLLLKITQMSLILIVFIIIPIVVVVILVIVVIIVGVVGVVIIL